MSVKIYVESTTKELVKESGNILSGYPPFAELFREKNTTTGTITIKTIHGERYIVKDALYSDVQDVTGTPYVSLSALWTALDEYFSTI